MRIVHLVASVLTGLASACSIVVYLIWWPDLTSRFAGATLGYGLTLVSVMNLQSVTANLIRVRLAVFTSCGAMLSIFANVVLGASVTRALSILAVVLAVVAMVRATVHLVVREESAS